MNLYKRMKVFYHRNEKVLVSVMYSIVIALSLFAILDPETFLRVFLQNNSPSSDVTSDNSDDLDPYRAVYFRFTTTERILPNLRAVKLPFAPTHHYCDEIFEKSARNFSYSEFYLEHMDAYKSALTMTGIMQEANVNEQSWAFHELGRLDFVNNVCETGFLAGHNSFQWLTAKPEVTVYSFEDAKFNWTEDLAIFLSAEFPDHFFFYEGETVKEIENFAQKHNKTRCDVIYVDSSKPEAVLQAEIDAFRKIANPHENLIVMDVHGDMSKSLAQKIWSGRTKSGQIGEHFSCEFRDGGDSLSTRWHNVSGFLIGSFIF